jgi:hypothetical protein
LKDWGNLTMGVFPHSNKTKCEATEILLSLYVC